MTADGREFRKARDGSAAADFEAEAAGLRWLEEAGAPVPEVVAVEHDPPALVLERIEAGALSAAGAERLGRDVATLHRAGAPAFGALPPDSPDRTLRIGLARLSVVDRDSWKETYARDLVLPLVAVARDRGTLSAADAAAAESVCDRLADLAGPDEPPARLHGDLWSGNILADPDGKGWLIDPAAYGGHREVDLAMLRLFGTPRMSRLNDGGARLRPSDSASQRIFAAYGEEFPLADGHAERVPLWQLLPLLVHAVLFGGSYGRSAGDAARRYT